MKRNWIETELHSRNYSITLSLAHRIEWSKLYPIKPDWPQCELSGIWIVHCWLQGTNIIPVKYQPLILKIEESYWKPPYKWYLYRFHTYIINYNTHSQKQQQQSSIFIFHSFHIHIIHIIQSSNTPLTHPLPRTSITQYINTIILISTYINHITQYSSSISLSYSIILLSQITTYPSLLPLIIPDYIQYIALFYSVITISFIINQFYSSF